MSLLRRGSSRISNDNFNSRLERERAKTGAITASLAWNDPSDLDLHANIRLANGSIAQISYANKKNAGGELDVDTHGCGTQLVDEPVENIYWKKPPPGSYTISAVLFKKRGKSIRVPFHAILKHQGWSEPLSVEGTMEGNKSRVDCFKFTVDEDGTVTMARAGHTAKATPALKTSAVKAIAKSKPAMKAIMKPAAKLKAKAKAKPKAKAKATTVIKAIVKPTTSRLKRTVSGLHWRRTTSGVDDI